MRLPISQEPPPTFTPQPSHLPLFRSITYDPYTMAASSTGLLAYEERPAPLDRNPTQTMWFNVQYEQRGDVPSYDKAQDAPLNTKRRQRAVFEGSGAAEGADGAGAGGVPAKRLRQGQRCFNCGSYGHSLRECWREYDAERVDAQRGAMGNAGDRGFAVRRYFSEGDGVGEEDGRHSPVSKGVRDLQREFPDVVPGQLSASLRAALGIGALDPPPWLPVMRALGLPPAYGGGAHRAAAGAALKSHPVPIGDDGEEEGEMKSAGAGNCEIDGETKGMNGAGGAAAVSNMEEGTGSDGYLATHGVTSEEEEGALPDFVTLPQFSRGFSADAGAAVVSMDSRPAAVQFPGVNADIPDGADPAVWNHNSTATRSMHDVGGMGGVEHPRAPQYQHQDQLYYHSEQQRHQYPRYGGEYAANVPGWNQPPPPPPAGWQEHRQQLVHYNYYQPMPPPPQQHGYAPCAPSPPPVPPPPPP